MSWPRMNSLLTAQFLPILPALPTFSLSGIISASRTSTPAHDSHFAIVGGLILPSNFGNNAEEAYALDKRGICTYASSAL